MNIYKIGTLLLSMLLTIGYLHAQPQFQNEPLPAQIKKKTKKPVTKKTDTKTKNTISKPPKKAKNDKKSTFFKHLNGHMNVGMGYDSNVYSSATDPYVDYSTATYEANGILTPVTSSGAFTYIDFLIAYDHKINKKLYLLADYKYKGRSYFGDTLKNANFYHQVASIGALYKLKNTNIRKRHITLKTFIGEDYTIYFDHDDGDHKFNSAGVDIYNRNQYIHYGLKTDFFIQQYSWNYHLKFLYEFLDYPTPAAWSELDHEHYFLSADAEYTTKKDHKTKFGYIYTVRDYLYRGSYDIVNAKPKLITVANDPSATRLYTYHDFFVKENLKLSDAYRAIMGYKYTYRIDGFAGYNTSHRNQITADIQYRLNKKIKAEAGLLYAYTDFPTAWAFDRQPTDLTLNKGDKFYAKTGGHLKGSYRQNKKFSYELDVKYNNYDSSDDRYVYDRLMTILSVKYRY